MLAYVVIEALNVWVHYCRCFYIATALGAKDSAGQRVAISPPVAITSADDAIVLAVHRVRRRLRGLPGPFAPLDEPRWHKPNEFLKVMRELSPSNLGDVQRALSLQPQTLQHLPTVRNFYAHRAQDTADRVRSLAPRYSVASSASPSEFLCSRQPGRPQPIVLDWLDDVRSTVELTV
jgi:hypothetical protein